MRAVVKRCAVSAVAVAVLFFAGCSSAPAPVTHEAETAKKPVAPTEPVAAKTALWPMYTAARSWAPDLVLINLAEREVPGYTNDAGKAALWEATFASPSLHKYRVDAYAITTLLPNIHKGAFAGLPLQWGGVTREAMPIDTSSISVDSDAAYQAAVADPGVAEWLKKNPTKKVTSMELGNAFRFHVPVWYILWGDKKDGYVVFVDAGSGKVLKK